MRRWTLLALLSLVLLLVVSVVGCGEDEVGQLQEGTEDLVEEELDVPESGAIPKGYLAGVRIENFAFEPAELTVTVGAQVVWTNYDSAIHTVDFDDFSSPELGRGGTFQQVFNEVGTFEYRCDLHPSMRARIEVVEQPAP
ncbi:MAG: plastocyanin/azurin family copper-binding protein [Candidatus Geothermincolia bacterium]